MYLLSLFTVLGGHLVSIGEYLLYCSICKCKYSWCCTSVPMRVLKPCLLLLIKVALPGWTCYSLVFPKLKYAARKDNK